MSDQNQSQVPESFSALYLAPGGYKLTLARDALYERYEFCEDLANMLTEHAANVKFDTGIDEQDVLERCRDGLLAEGSGVSSGEVPWVIGRLAELMNWQNLPVSVSEIADNPIESDDRQDDLGDPEQNRRPG